jgi:hypothetical protein
MKHLFLASLVAALQGSAVAQVNYQFVPNSPPWPEFHTPNQVPTTTCVTVNSQQNGDQQYPSASYTVCN